MRIQNFVLCSHISSYNVTHSKSMLPGSINPKILKSFLEFNKYITRSTTHMESNNGKSVERTIPIEKQCVRLVISGIKNRQKIKWEEHEI